MTAARRASLHSLTSKRSVVLFGLLGAAMLLVSGSQPWVHGTVVDAVLGRSASSATGSQVAPAAVAAGLVAGAAAIACATSGLVVRRIAAAAMVLAAVLGAVVTIRVAGAPGTALGSASAAALRRQGVVQAEAQVGPWLLIAALACLLVAVAGMGAMLGSGRWNALPSRYDAPAGDADVDALAPSPRTHRSAATTPPVSSWEQLSRGHDPTIDPTIDATTHVASGDRSGDPSGDPVIGPTGGAPADGNDGQAGVAGPERLGH